MDLQQNVKPVHNPPKSRVGKVFSSKAFKMSIPLWIMFFPVAIYYLIFSYAPMAGLIIAFKNYNLNDGLFNSPWASHNGFGNFVLLFSQPDTFSAIRNTFLLSILSITVSFPAPIVLAVLLNEIRVNWYKRIVQTLIYLPHFFSWVVVSGIIVVIFSIESGVVNSIIKGLGIEPIRFLYNEFTWVLVFLGSDVWKEAGFSSIIYLAALTQIDSQLYEAAAIDGANKWKQMRYITFPCLIPTIVIMLILAIQGVLGVGFERVYNLSNELVGDIADVIDTYIYRMGIAEQGEYSLTTAMGLFSSLVSATLVISANKIARKFDRQLW